ncbi:hypothetical protein [Hymenobacter psychrophilus]|uniref:Uncharacterized protein n=1 Tax=Hymenobacter psychrophilus TaxID=651662 RepID=A0A1H3GSE8_9BACT|nr:hypothetical protein [Hymenobacter psychrophilus]SDY06243.1 hypothetical protein SAMN04488069_105155 [Hymenobacter psychrophilus]
MQIRSWPVVLLLVARPDAPPTVTFRAISATEYQQAKAAGTPAKVPTTFPVQARNGQLTIPTTAGPQHYRNVVIDAAAVARGQSEEQETRYAYLGLLTPFRRHLVEVTLYETGEWWLISPEGRRLTLYGPPLYSPDQRSVAAISAGLEYSGGQPNLVQLLRLKNGTLRPFWELRPTAWEPEELFWTGPNTLYLKGEKWTGGHQGTLVYWRLTVSK